MRLAALASLALATCGGPGGPPGSTADAEIVSVRDLGIVRNPNLSSVLRDGGVAGRVGGKALWAFGDTSFPFAAADGQTRRSSSGAYAELDAPTVLSDTLDARGAPLQLLPFTSDELAYNDAHGADDRFALWPTTVIAKGENAMILYARVKVRPGGAEPLSTGFAEVEPFSTVAVRAPEVFLAPEPQLHDAAALDAGDLYLYACAAGGMCKVARAAYGRVTERGAYTFWTGSSWSPDAGAAAATIPGSTTGFSVSYNTYLEHFVSFASTPATGKIAMRVADRPEGPWGAPIAVTDAGSPIHATVQHPELASDAGRKLYVSYVVDVPGELHLLEIQLR